ncbi:DUF551 domain-containing protein [Ensifer sp. ENS02]|uniref:DUF551 domain-containing protein n=1 Tax=Ensifer sp. ENS02 TaxID=2769290 RepID=UPI00177CF9FF|nr:DUF551 domain-containing protein [Ensifer sp. ENS02]MBD9519331.1 DUF551 domain-containing protein [Ensifer sp. ENS02]
MLKLSPENKMLDIEDLNRFKIGDEVIAEECSAHDRFEGVIVGIELSRLYGSEILQPDITLLHDGCLTDGFKPSDLRKSGALSTESDHEARSMSALAAAPNAETTASSDPVSTQGLPSLCTKRDGNRTIAETKRPDYRESAKLSESCHKIAAQEVTLKPVKMRFGDPDIIEAPYAAPSAPDGWQRIDSAPKHQNVLVWREDAGEPWVAQFTDATFYDAENGDPDDEAWFDLAGRYEGVEAPTHWRPLPAPPAAGDKP